MKNYQKQQAIRSYQQDTAKQYVMSSMYSSPTVEYALPSDSDLNAENSDVSDDEFDFYKARESAGQLQNDFLGWQGSTQKKKAAESINTATEYDTWVKDERAKLSKTLSENQQKHFNYFADQHDSVHRPWAKKYEAQQRKTYGIDTQNAVLASNRATLSANLHDIDFVRDSIGQIVAATDALARLQGFGEQESAELRIHNINDAIKSVLQGKIDTENLDDAVKLYKQNGHFLTASSQDEIKNNIRTLHSRTQKKKSMDNTGNALLQMDEDVAAAHLADSSWLQTMNISEEMIPELTEYSTVQRQKNLREEKKILDKQELGWLDRVFATHRQDPAQALRIVHERKDMEPQWRNSMIDAIKTGRIDLEDDTSTVLALQERMFAGDAPKHIFINIR